MWLFHAQGDEAFLFANRFHAGQGLPGREPGAACAAGNSELNHMMSAEALDQIGGRAFGDQLAVIDNRQPVTEALGFVHIMRGQQNRAAVVLESTNDVP